MKRVLIAVLGVALATSAAAVPQYSQLRQDYPQVDDAIAAASESDLHGTFNRLSALYQRSPIATAGPDAGTDDLLPENFLRNLEATLIDLQEDLGKDQVGQLTPDQKINLLQVVRIYAFARPIELWQSEEFTTCTGACPIGDPEAPPCPPCVDDDPAVLNEVQDTVSAARPLYQAVYLAAGSPGTVPTPAGLDADNFIEAIEGLAYIRGVESIDD